MPPPHHHMTFVAYSFNPHITFISLKYEIQQLDEWSILIEEIYCKVACVCLPVVQLHVESTCGEQSISAYQGDSTAD